MKCYASSKREVRGRWVKSEEWGVCKPSRDRRLPACILLQTLHPLGCAPKLGGTITSEARRADSASQISRSDRVVCYLYHIPFRFLHLSIVSDTYFCAINTVRCPVNDWTTTGQRADNKRTTTSVGLVMCWLWDGVFVAVLYAIICELKLHE